MGDDPPQARLCALTRNSPDEEYGMVITTTRDRRVIIKHVDRGGPADKAWLCAKDVVLIINGHIVDGQATKEISTWMRENPLRCELLVMKEAGAEWYAKRKLPISLNIPNISKVGQWETKPEPQKVRRQPAELYPCLNNLDIHENSGDEVKKEEGGSDSKTIIYTRTKLSRGDHIDFLATGAGQVSIGFTWKDVETISDAEIEEIYYANHVPKRALIEVKPNDKVTVSFEERQDSWYSAMRVYIDGKLITSERAEGIRYHVVCMTDSSGIMQILEESTRPRSPSNAALRRTQSDKKPSPPSIPPEPRIVSMVGLPSVPPEPKKLTSAILIPSTTSSGIGSSLAGSPKRPSIPTLTPVEGPGFSSMINSVDIFYPSTIKHIKHIAHGAQGAISLVSTEYYPKVALKYFDRDHDFAAKRRSRIELHNALKLNSHPNIVQPRGILFDSPSDLANEVPPIGFLMEYMENGSLYQVIHRGGYEYDYLRALDWIRQASSALAFLHRRNIVHRDVKPANLLLSDNYRTLKIADLGLSTTIQQSMSAGVGTFCYIAPEMMAEKIHYDEKVDSFSLAITIWELFHRKPPFEEKNWIDIVNKVPQGLRPDIDPELVGPLFVKFLPLLWAGDPEKRMAMDKLHFEVKKAIETQQNFEHI